jgi:hypothetical protein
MRSRSSSWTGRQAGVFESCLLALVGTLWLLSSAARAQAPDEELGGRPTLVAQPLKIAPTLDGLVREDPAWQDIPGAVSFWQTRPFAGEAASEDTEVRIGYTADTLWIGVVCLDREPSRIIVSDSRRDASLEETDSFQVVLDTFGDGQNGFVFGTNPAGIEYDGQVVNQGEGGFGSGGGGFNLNWDGSWQVRATITEYGWSAEMAIPFRTLRYPGGRAQRWGVNFQRNIRRRNEAAFWSPLERQFGLHRVSSAGSLQGLEVPQQRLLQLVPYVLATGREAADREGSDTDVELGLDAKYGVTPSLTLDATYNTDFAQVEADEQQINLDRFNLFFPEKRPFFLENAGLFSVGEPGIVELFFSRRIGIGPGGQEIPIDGGVRLSGKSGRTNLGFLAMRSADADRDGSAVPESTFGVARVSRELQNRSRVGALWVGRDNNVQPGAPAAVDDNHAFALDGQWGVGEYHTLSGFVAGTRTPGISEDDHSFQLDYALAAPKWLGQVGFLEVGEGFNPEVGFLSRRGFRRPSGFALRRIRPKNLLGFHELRPHVSYDGYWDFDGFQESEYVHLDNHWEWRSGHQIHTGINFTRQGVKTPFEISPGVVVPPGEYSHDELQIVGITNRGAPVSFSTTVISGGFFGGDRLSFDGTLRLRRGERLTSEVTWSYDDIDLPGGDFEVNLGRLRLSYSFRTNLQLQSLVQYNDRTDRVSTNLRLSWLRTANTGLFVVYNEVDDFGTRLSLQRPDRSLILKYSRLVNVFGGR